MVSSHGYDKYDVDMMIPFERDVMTSIINDRIEKEKRDLEPGSGGVQWEVQTGAPTD